MSKKTHAQVRARTAQAGEAKSHLPRWSATLIIAALVIVIGFWGWKALTSSPGPQTAKPAREQSTNVAAGASVEARPEFLKLKGRWQRLDGEYVLEIKGVDRSGIMDAGYLNPNPIHVAKAAAFQEDSATKVFVELRDVNYPGSTYTLVYDVAKDVLEGNYFQALERQNFDVVFVRMK